MGLPEINIAFKGLASAAIKRSEKGLVALLIKDSKATKNRYFINGIEEVPGVSELDEKNISYIKDVLKGGSKVIAELVKESDTPGTYLLNESLANLKTMYWNYLVMPEAETGEISDIVTFIKMARDKDKKTFKTVVSTSVAPDHEGIINLQATGIKIQEKVDKVEAQEFTPRMAGILAGMPFTRSATYYVIPEVESVDHIADQNAAIDSGKLILINDEGVVKIASGVNSLTSIAKPKTEDMKDILIIEKMDFVKDDISKVFKNEYVGKVINTYDNKQIFVTNIHTYFENLIRDYDFFDKNEENKVWVDAESNKLYLESKGIDTVKMSEEDIKKANTGKKVFLLGKVRFTNTMSDLDLDLAM